jgi:hypothetical protein
MVGHTLPSALYPFLMAFCQSPHNTYVLMVLFDLAHWHGLAKLRMHTDPTLSLFSHVTTCLGTSLHVFKEKTCGPHPTRELERERVAQTQHQETNLAKTVPESSKSKPRKLDSNTRQPKQLNLKTYKYHALGDYVHTIRRVGTTDSYSTQPVSFS